MHFLEEGDREYEPMVFRSNGVSVAPPSLQTIPHPKGLCLDVMIPVKGLFGSGEWVFFEYLGGVNAGVKTARLGFQVKNFQPFRHQKWYTPSFDLGLFGTFRGYDLGKMGSLFNVGMHFNPSKDLRFSLSLTHSNKDMLQYDIMGTGTRSLEIREKEVDDAWSSVSRSWKIYPQYTEFFLDSSFEF